MNDLRFIFRQLLKAPGFALAVVLSVALGIGATTTVFCWMQSIISRPVPGAHEQDQLVVITTKHGDTAWDGVSRPDIADIRGLSDTFVDVFGSQVTPACLDDNGSVRWIYGQLATANLFSALGVTPLLGRTFSPNEDAVEGGHPVLVLSETLWRTHFASDPAIIGRKIKLNQQIFTVIGVVPAAFAGTMSGLRSDFWASVSMHSVVAGFGSPPDQRHDRWLHTQARLRKGVSIEQAQAALDTLSVRLEQSYPKTNREVRLRVIPFEKAPYGAQPILAPVLRVLLIVSIGVLLIVAANTSNLLLVRATARQKELAVRGALGASRWHLARLLITESLLLAGLGGVLGLILADLSVSSLMSFFPPTHLPLGLDVTLDGGTIAFTALITLAVGLAFGAVPAWNASRADMNGALKHGGRGSGAAAHHRTRNLFVVSEIALAVVLLVGAALCIQSVRQTRKLDLGLNPDRVLIAGLRVGMAGYDEAAGKNLYTELHRRLGALPGVEDAALFSWLPLGFEGTGGRRVDVEGYIPRPSEDMDVLCAIVSPRYFSTLSIPLLAGRDFTDADNSSAERVAIINENAAKRFWPGQDPIGRKFRMGGRPHRVIGVALAGRYRSLNEEPKSFVYIPYLQGVPELNLSVAVRTTANPSSMASAVREEIRRLDPALEPWTIQPMTQYIEASFVAPAMAARMLGGLGVVAVVLAAIGIYGVISYAVSLRTQEFGVRMALGAAPSQILRLVVRAGLILAAAGIAIGLGVASAVTRFMAGVLYGVSPYDFAAFTLVPAFLAIVALGACCLPALRATRVNPTEALRAE